MIIDFRIRPPIAPFLRLGIYTQIELVERIIARPLLGSLAASAREASLAKLNTELDVCQVRHGVVWGRAVPDPAESTSNDDIAGIVAGSDGFYSGFGGICVGRDIGAAVADIDYAVAALGLKGVTLEPGMFSPPMYFDDRRLYPLYQRCQELNAIVSTTMGVILGPDLSHSDPQRVARVAADFPKLEIVVSHGFWPWVEASCGIAFRHPNIYLLPDAYGVGMPGHRLWVEAANTFLGDRLLFGSAFPVLGVQQAVEGYRRLPFADGVFEKVTYHNAARLLGLPAS